MAIPFLPSDEETRAMDELWQQLYQVLRQILLRQHHVPSNTNLPRHGRQQQQPQPQPQSQEVDAPVAAMPDVIPCLPLPDLVPLASPSSSSVSTTATSHPLPPPRRPRRRRTQRRSDKEVATATVDPKHKIQVRDNWTQVGEDLRLIAEEFETSLEDIDPKRLEDTPGHKGVSFMTLVALPSFRGSVWTGLICLFGWQVLQRMAG